MIPRLHVEAPLIEGAGVHLSPAQAHYLKNVLRREAQAPLKLFNKRDGEFAAVLAEIGKKNALAEIGARLRRPEAEPDVIVLFAPIKRAGVELVIEKGTELGAARFIPVFTDRTNTEKLRIDRLAAIALEAAEQCGRLSVPTVDAPRRMPEALLAWDRTRTLIYCDEAGDNPNEDWGGQKGRAAPLIETVLARDIRRAGLLIGPEGGFSADERAWLRALPFVTPVTLGPRILRAETAAIVSLALWQAAVGDLKRSE